MALIGNEKVSQLVEITAPEIAPNDLFYIVDSSARESKKMQAYQLAVYLNSSGSIQASHAITADTASFVLPGGITFTVPSASLALLAASALSASWAAFAVSSSWSTTASYAVNGEVGESQTASYLKYQGFPNGTASFALTASTVRNAFSASFLVYPPPFGTNNGTASYALAAQNVNHSTTSDTASYLQGGSFTVDSASYAGKASLADVAQTANVATYLEFSPMNGTASYALTAGGFSNALHDYGVFYALQQSASISQLDDVYVYSSLATPSQTNIEAVGTIVVPYTSSIPVNEILNLVVKDRDTGVETIIDFTPVYYSLSPTIGDWENYNSGSIKIPYTLMGTSSMLGDYVIFVSASSNIYIEPLRINKFSISSVSDVLTVNSGLPLEFYLFPTTIPVTFLSDAGGPFTDIAYNMVHTTGSENIYSINLDYAGVGVVKYLWSLPNLLTASFVNNPGLSNLGGLPSSLTYLNCDTCGLTSLPDLSGTSISHLDFRGNGVTTFPTLPETMSYINCSNNSISSLLFQMPFGLTEFFCDNTNITSITTGFPNSVVSMSFANNTGLTNFGISFPQSLTSFNINNSPVASLPIPNANLKYISASNCSLSQFTMDLLCSQSLVNAASSSLWTGSIDITGNGPLLASTVSDYVGPLTVTYLWTVLHD